MEGWGDVIIGAEEQTGVNFEEFNFNWRIKRRIGVSWGLSPELKLYPDHHIMP